MCVRKLIEHDIICTVGMTSQYSWTGNYSMSPVMDLAGYFWIDCFRVFRHCVGMCIEQSTLKLRAVPH